MDEALFNDYGKIINRTPLYSYLRLFGLNNETKNLDELVRHHLDDPAFLEGIYWSSPQLFQRVIRFKKGDIKGLKEIKLIQTLKKYLIRASTRCTPYGIYAGSSIADIGIEGVHSDEIMERKVRIDMGLLQQIKCRIESDSGVWPYLRYAINNSLYSVHHQYRFMETIIERGKSHYQISSIDQTDLLKKIIVITQRGNASVNDIYSLISEDILFDEFKPFVKELISMQFLVSELQLGLTIENELKRYIHILKRLEAEGVAEAKRYISLFSFIENLLFQFEKLPIGSLPLKEIESL